MTNTVQSGQTVSVHYRGTLDDGSEFDNSRTRGEAMAVQVGSGQLIAGFDAALLGMTVGEVKNIHLGAEEAYGPVNNGAVQEVPKTMFPPDFGFKAGEIVQGQGPAGQPLVATIMEEKKETVLLDFNHPMAGKDLNFEIEVMSINKQEG
jgi:FKBP-type peptidyl-prolyl cis-trans isomerase 2